MTESADKQKHFDLWNTIQSQLKQRKANAKWWYDVLVFLKAKKYAGDSDDKITNPCAIDDRGTVPLYRNIEEKRIAFELSVESEGTDDAKAWTGFKTWIPLGGPGAELNDVEYIAGLWRVQNKEHYKTINIQDKDFVLGDKLNRTEHTHFEFYQARSVGWGGCGQFCDEKPDYVVAKYETGRGTFYAYGCKITDSDALATARAHLAGQIYMAYKDLIDADRENMANESVLPEDELITFREMDPIRKTERVRKFRLLKKLNRVESTGFEFYVATSIEGWNEPDYIVAKYKTGRGPFYAYGCRLTSKDALATARAHLAARVYDAYQDLIEADTVRALGKEK